VKPVSCRDVPDIRPDNSYPVSGRNRISLSGWSSVASERLFSTAGDVLTDSRSRLLPDRAEHLICLKINLLIY
jgi:hypothetical protein